MGTDGWRGGLNLPLPPHGQGIIPKEVILGRSKKQKHTQYCIITHLLRYHSITLIDHFKFFIGKLEIMKNNCRGISRKLVWNKITMTFLDFVTKNA